MIKKPKLTRPVHIAPKILFIDGIPGSGKSMIAPLIGSFNHVEKYRLEHIFEYVCVLHWLGKIETDAASSLIKIYSDLGLYNSMISREVNLRPKDNTGLLNNPFPLRYIKRLWAKDGNVVVDQIKKNNAVYQTNTHAIFPVVNLAFTAFEDRFRIIQMVRDPVFLVEHWGLFGIERHGKDPRDFMFWLEGPDGHAYPWFSHGWIEKFISLKPMDKVIAVVDWLDKQRWQVFNSLNEQQQKQVMIIPFEKFATDPFAYFDHIESFLDVNRTKALKRMMKRQRIPRKVVTAGRGYTKYGWQAPDAQATTDSEYKRTHDGIAKHASPEMIEKLDAMSKSYQERFLNS